MEHAIEQVAELIQSEQHAQRGRPMQLARALAEAGLINGFRPGKWWRVMGPDSHLWAETSSEREARERMRPGDRLYRQWETERSTWWVPVEGVDRAEGDGKASQ